MTRGTRQRVVMTYQNGGIAADEDSQKPPWKTVGSEVWTTGSARSRRHN
jgi:hypothetical protein